MLKRQNVKDSDLVKVTFVIPHDPAQPRVSVVGDFNSWQPATDKFVKRSNNTRSVTVELVRGQRYAFRYYTEDGEWLNDPEADAYETSEHGSQNCVVVV